VTGIYMYKTGTHLSCNSIYMNMILYLFWGGDISLMKTFTNI